MMGSGKTSVGRHLARIDGRDFEDTDSMIQRRLGRSIAEIFRLYGEDAFRAHETAILRSLVPRRALLATGGGIVLRAENWAEMRRLGVTVYLEASAETLIARLERSRRTRPLLLSDDWRDRLRRLLELRRPLYEQADLRIPLGDEGIERVADRAYEALVAWT